jgi:serpin B
VANLGETVAIAHCDFAHSPEIARQLINDAVARDTNGKITDVIPDNVIDRATRLMLVNANYVDALWAFPFPRWETRKEPFYPAHSEAILTNIMHLEARIPYYRGLGYQAALLPYQESSLAMVVVLPDDPLSDFVASQDFAVGIGDLVNRVLDGRKDSLVALSLPSFRIESSFEAKETLKSLGVRLAFMKDADLGGICDKPIFIDSVMHKAYINVGEKGTEAAAVTTVRGQALSRTIKPEPDIQLAIDRPFLFMVVNVSSGLPIFIGQFTRPAANR